VPVHPSIVLLISGGLQDTQFAWIRQLANGDSPAGKSIVTDYPDRKYREIEGLGGGGEGGGRGMGDARKRLHMESMLMGIDQTRKKKW
jgi:hypothetical protein